MNKKENVSVRLTKEHEQMATIPKLNSALFTTDNYEVDNSLLLYEDKIREYAIGWCYTDELPMRVNTTFHREIAVMYEDPENEEKPKFWMHLGLDTFIVLFIPKMLEEDNKPSLVEQLQQQLAEMKEQLDACQELRKLEAKESIEQYMRQSQELVDMEKQLAEKDKEIERLKAKQWHSKIDLRDEILNKIYREFNWLFKNDKNYVNLRNIVDNAIDNYESNQRHQICKEIRHRALLLYDNCPDHKIERMYGVRKCLLDQIEKEEE